MSASSQLDFTLLTECSKLYHYTFNFTMIGERKTYCEEHYREQEDERKSVCNETMREKGLMACILCGWTIIRYGGMVKSNGKKKVV